MWTIDEYELMIERGILNENERVELIRGEIVKMAPIGIRHAACVTRLQEIFYNLLHQSVTVSIQNPIKLPNNSEPEPDVALLERRSDQYAQRRPTAHDVLLLIEVADTTLATDRSEKVPLYAEAGIQAVWLVNLDKGMVEVYLNPMGKSYQEVHHAGRGQRLSLPGGLQGEISVAEILGTG